MCMHDLHMLCVLKDLKNYLTIALPQKGGQRYHQSPLRRQQPDSRCAGWMWEATLVCFCLPAVEYM